MPFIFNNRAVSHLEKAITDTETELRIPLADFEQFNRFGSGADAFMFCILRGPIEREIVKIIPDESNYPPDQYLVCERGQGGTVAQDWPAGTLLYLSTTADHYSSIIQRGNERTVGFNPNGVISPDYAGEKIMQDLGCAVRWWQAITPVDPYWHLIAGEPCAGELFENPTGFFISDVWIPAPAIIPTWLPITKERYPTGPQYWQPDGHESFINPQYYWQSNNDDPPNLIHTFDVYRNGGPDLRANWPISAVNIRGLRIYTGNASVLPRVEIDMGPGPPGWQLCTKTFLNVASGADIEFELPTCDPGYTSDEIYGIRVWTGTGASNQITLIEVADADQTDLWKSLNNQICWTPVAGQGTWGTGGGGTPPGWVSSFDPGFLGGKYILNLQMYINPGTIDNRTACPNYPSPPPDWGRRLQYVRFTEYSADITFDRLELYISEGPSGPVPWLVTAGYLKIGMKMSAFNDWFSRRIDWYRFNLNDWVDIAGIRMWAPLPFRISQMDFWDNGP